MLGSYLNCSSVKEISKYNNNNYNNNKVYHFKRKIKIYRNDSLGKYEFLLLLINKIKYKDR